MKNDIAEPNEFWADYHARLAAGEAGRAINIGLRLGYHDQAYKIARRAHREAVMSALHAGNDLRDMTAEEYNEKTLRTCCGECGQELAA
jgi:uncharacterized membrane protein YukC